MKERRYVKFKVDIYDDTKTKIIDQRPERDFIHYFFARCIILAGKSDCEGELYMAKNIPYTIETLAIEFSRENGLVKLALGVLIELEMIEVIEGNIYRVKNFVKHQNIKVKEKAEINNKEETSMSISNKEAHIEYHKQIEDGSKNKRQEDSKNEVQENIEEYELERENEMDKKESGVGKHLNSLENIREDKTGSIETTHVDMRNADNNMSEENIKVKCDQDNLVILKMKDNKKSNQKKKKSSDTELAVEEIDDDSSMFFFSEGDLPPLSEGERIVMSFSFD